MCSHIVLLKEYKEVGKLFMTQKAEAYTKENAFLNLEKTYKHRPEILAPNN